MMIKKIILVCSFLIFLLPSKIIALESDSKWKINQIEESKTSNHILEGNLKKESKFTKEGKKYDIYSVTYTIPEDYEEETITIVPTEYQNFLFSLKEEDIFEIKIKNLSPFSYHYINNSYVLSTEDIRKYQDGLLNQPYLEAVGFNNINLIEASSFYRTKNSAIQNLYGIKWKWNIKSYMLEEGYLDKKLKEKGYQGIEELSLYYLDFYSTKYGVNVKRLEDLPNSAITELLSGPYTKTKKESSKEVIELAYNYLLNNLYAFSYDLTKINSENSREYSVGSYMRHEKCYEEINQLLKKQLHINQNGETTIIQMPKLYINKKYMATIYRNYYSGIYTEFVLEKGKK